MELSEIEKKEIQLLPTLAMVAFAMRSAQRVLPFIEQLGKEIHATAVKCLDIVECVTSGKGLNVEDNQTYRELYNILQNAINKEYSAQKRPSACFAIQSVKFAFECAFDKRFEQAHAATRTAYDAVLSDSGAEVSEFDRVQRVDIEWFLAMAANEKWGNETVLETSSLPPIQPVLPISKKGASSIFTILNNKNKYEQGSARSLMAGFRLSHIPITAQLIPMEGYLALSSRTTMRLVEILPQHYRRKVFLKLMELQHYVDEGVGEYLLPVSNDFCGVAEEIEKVHNDSSSAAKAASRAIYALGRTCRVVWAEEEELARSFSHTSVVYAQQAIQITGKADLLSIEQDIDAVLTYTKQLEYSDLYEKSGMRQRLRFPQLVFAACQSFDTNEHIMGESIITLSPIINDELIARLAEYPRMLYELHPREFEELIARVFEVYGFEVELTAATRDGGRDIIAIMHSPACVKYLIDCKRYSEKNLVGLAAVQRLHGVVKGDLGNKAILATTSSFTRDAKHYLDKPHVRFELEGHNFDGIRQWLVEADRLNLVKKALGKDFIANNKSILCQYIKSPR